jgi:7-carboxy-7-deazaguanine synthase
MRELFVAECFGPTFQGEGPSLGRRAVFLRLGGCNLQCGGYEADGAHGWVCDTGYTWNHTKYDMRSEIRRMSYDAVASALRDAGLVRGKVADWSEQAKLDYPILVVTGGEPLLQQDALAELLGGCEEWADADGLECGDVEVETNGTVVPNDALSYLGVTFNVSPKLANSGNAYGKRENWRALERFAELAWSKDSRFKFVCREAADLGEVEQLALRYTMPPSSIWIMPEGTGVETIVRGMRALEEGVLARGWNLTIRNHILLHGNARGF